MHSVLTLFGVVLIGVGISTSASAQVDTSSADRKELEALNQQYIRSVLTSNVGWFEQHLVADFQCTNPDGSMVDRAAFLKQTALPIKIGNVQVHDVNIRVMGDFALIHAVTTYTWPDGKVGSSRYTDAWRRTQGEWRAVSAHITPVQ
jgi:ketosteroid isomerase-like protein